MRKFVLFSAIALIFRSECVHAANVYKPLRSIPGAPRCCRPGPRRASMTMKSIDPPAAGLRGATSARSRPWHWIGSSGSGRTKAGDDCCAANVNPICCPYPLVRLRPPFLFEGPLVLCIWLGRRFESSDARQRNRWLAHFELLPSLSNVSATSDKHRGFPTTCRSLKLVSDLSSRHLDTQQARAGANPIELG